MLMFLNAHIAFHLFGLLVCIDPNESHNHIDIFA